MSKSRYESNISNFSKVNLHINQENFIQIYHKLNQNINQNKQKKSSKNYVICLTNSTIALVNNSNPVSFCIIVVLTFHLTIFTQVFEESP